MLWYVIKLIVMLPLIGLMIWGSLRLLKRLQARMGQQPGTSRRISVVETLMLSPTQRLVVVRFGDRDILVASGRNGLVRLAETPALAAETAA